MRIQLLNLAVAFFALAPFAASVALANDQPKQADAAAPATQPAKTAKPKRVCTLSRPDGGSAIPRRSCHTEYPVETKHADAQESVNSGLETAQDGKATSGG